PEPTKNAEAAVNPATTTLTVTTSGDAAILDITPSSATGTFSSSDTSGTSLEFNVTTDNITGYNLSISHADATTPAPLTNEDLSTDLASLPAGTSIADSDFNTSTYVGYYGYKPSMLNSVSNSNYIPAPTTTATTINETAQANTTSDNYTIALGANIDYTKPAGTYTNTFILTAVANNVAYTINYLDNTGTGGTTGTDVANLPSSEASSTATASSFTLSSTEPTRTGYDFAGWCDGVVTHNATGNDTCSGTTYQASSAYSFASPSSTSTNVANLYAMWNVKTFAITLGKTNATAIVIDDTSYTGSSATLTYGNHTISGTYASNYEFSSWATSNSTNLAITSTTSASTTITVHGAATLTLNGKSSVTDYCTANNIADSNCMQKMVASNCTTTAKTVYDARDGSSYKVQKLSDGKCWLLDNLRLGYAGFASGVNYLDSTNTNTTNSIATSTFNGWKKTSGFTSYTAPMINTASANTTTTSYGSGSGKIGVYYNYCAATMQSYCYASGSGTGNASQDVCPKGWRMPTGGSSGEYKALYTAYSSNATNFRNALSTPLSGYFYDSSAYSQGSYGYFWSSTYNNGSYMYYLIVGSSNVSPQDSDDRGGGFSVRCVLK
ncbi:MAG: FISUMP domain-containing protein, partial [Candidatus Saccharibacteria bacterium]|nr:FISUMP domain-containing protein [Candidatus Saccharibacteria bacterium]